MTTRKRRAYFRARFCAFARALFGLDTGGVGVASSCASSSAASSSSGQSSGDLGYTGFDNVLAVGHSGGAITAVIESIDSPSPEAGP